MCEQMCTKIPDNSNVKLESENHKRQTQWETSLTVLLKQMSKNNLSIKQVFNRPMRALDGVALRTHELAEPNTLPCADAQLAP